MNIDVYNKIIENEGLVYKIASRYKDYYNMEDLYQAGCIGIMKAYKKYNMNSNSKFSTYAYKYILGEMIDFIRKDKSIIISDEAYEIYKRYLHIKEVLYSKFERDPTFNEICNFMQINENNLLSIIESISFVKSIEEDEVVYNSFSVDDRENVDTEILLRNELELLNEFDRSLIDYRYFKGYTQDETARMLGISQVNVSRKEKLILNKIKEKIAA